MKNLFVAICLVVVFAFGFLAGRTPWSPEEYNLRSLLQRTYRPRIIIIGTRSQPFTHEIQQECGYGNTSAFWLKSEDAAIKAEGAAIELLRGKR